MFIPFSNKYGKKIENQWAKVLKRHFIAKDMQAANKLKNLQKQTKL
jgi:hypothetical protein